MPRSRKTGWRPPSGSPSRGESSALLPPSTPERSEFHARGPAAVSRHLSSSAWWKSFTGAGPAQKPYAELPRQVHGGPDIAVACAADLLLVIRFRSLTPSWRKPSWRHGRRCQTLPTRRRFQAGCTAWSDTRSSACCAKGHRGPCRSRKQRVCHARRRWPTAAWSSAGDRRCAGGDRRAARQAPEPATLFFIHDCSHQDIAVFLGLPVATVNNRQHPARSKLKERMLVMVNETFQRPRLARLFRQPDRSSDRSARRCRGRRCSIRTPYPTF